jgi:hypothetical protein
LFQDQGADVLMSHGITSSKRRLLVCLVAVIAVGLGSRMIHSGFVVVDKYLGYALYAAMVYLLFSLFCRSAPLRKAVVVMLIMTVLETFQLTAIPLGMSRSTNIAIKIIGRLIGTTFSWLDLAAYIAGIIVVFFGDYRCLNKNRKETR